MIAVCPICGDEVDTDSPHAVRIELAMARDLKKVIYQTQEFFCHLNCIKRTFTNVSVDLLSD
jgi:hypothetical protein